MIELRSRSWSSREWPRFRQGAKRDEADWISSLDDRELVRLVRGLASVDRAVAKCHKLARASDAPSEFRPPDLEERP